MIAGLITNHDHSLTSHTKEYLPTNQESPDDHQMKRLMETILENQLKYDQPTPAQSATVTGFLCSKV
jgi:hypothetical protein